MQRYRLLDIHAVEIGIENTPFVGRQSELNNLLTYWRRCRQHQQRHLVGLVGEAGIGKTRLMQALRQALTDQPDEPPLRWIDVHCPAYLSTSPFALLRLLLAQCLAIQANAPVELWRQALSHLLAEETNNTPALDLPLLEQSLGLHPSFVEGRDVAEQVRHAQLVAVFKTLLMRLCQTTPLIVAIDDIYHADPPSLDILNHLIESLDALPLLWLVLYRRQWLPPWATNVAATPSIWTSWRRKSAANC